METLTANQAKTQFGELILKAQQHPVQISKNGKPVAVVLSMNEFSGMESLKLQLLQQRTEQAKNDIKNNQTLDGEAFFDELELGHYDG
ncbi:MAG: type II toxin-antitoxin system Phd/YefM family antitoxin [Gammaproteobacteria bacterium]|nr:type II toxin-antitoxin system Phd/YefM family antitoxin [Gammaproteobacteria bacterium]